MMTLASWIVLLVILSAPFSIAGSNLGLVRDATVQSETTAEEVVARYLEAVGGIDALKDVDSKRITYWVHMLGRDAYLMERSWTRPHGMQTGAPGATTYTVTEGERSWRVSPTGRRELPASVAGSLSKKAYIDGPLVDPMEKGITLAYSGVVRYDMTDLYRVSLTFSDGIQWELFFDTGTGLLRRMTQPSFLMLNDEIKRGPDATYTYYDYRPVGSLLFPYFWIQAMEDHTHLFVVEDIQLGE